MNNLLKKIIYLCSLSSLIFSLPNASADALDTFTVIDQKFSMQGPSFADLCTSQGACPTGTAPWGTITEGEYVGTGFTNDIISFDFFSTPTYMYMDADNQGSANTPAGSILGGPAFSIDLVNLTADMSSWFVQWNGTEFLQGNNANFAPCIDSPFYSTLRTDVTVTNNFNNTYTLDWNSCIETEPFVGFVGTWQLVLRCDSITCPDALLGPSDTLEATQGAGATRTVLAGAGNVVITSDLGASPAGYTYTWVSETDGGITDLDANEGSFSFDPSGLTPGFYAFSSISEHTLTSTKAAGYIVINVVTSAGGLDIDDDDNDGIINQYDDVSLTASQLQAENSNSTNYVIKSDKGSLKLGATAFCSGTAARVSQADLAANAGTNCTAIANSADDSSIKAVGIGGYHDFEVHGLGISIPAEVVKIVIPLNAALPVDAVYRKFNNNIGSGNWGTFITGDGDLLESAAETSTGVCPDPGSASYTNGLTAGDHCIQLTITDGGKNDADSSINGQVIDPGAIAQINNGTEAELSSGCSMSNHSASVKQHSEWLVLVAFIAWLGFMSYRQKRVN